MIPAKKLAKLGEFYAQALVESGVDVDILYGPAYKGITLVAAASIAYANVHNKDIPFAFNRKEAKDHGEGGVLVGAPLKGKAVILDDVITAGTSVRESVVIINDAGATPAGVLIALNRQEKGVNDVSAIDEVSEQFSMPVISIISLEHIIEFIESDTAYDENIAAIKKYQKQYGL